MKRNPHDCDTPASGVAVTAVGADDEEGSTLPPAPGQPPSGAWDVPTPPSLEVPALRGSLADGLNGFDEVMPRAVELEGERRTPRQVPAARPASKAVTSPPPVPRRYLLEAASVMAISLVLVVMVHVLMLPAPAVRPGAPVPIGAATIECLAADPEVSATSSTNPIPTWSCTWGGRLKCVAPNGCQIYTWERDPSLSDWKFLAAGGVAPLGKGLWQTVAPAVRAVVKLERP